MIKLEFYKVCTGGNDFIIVDNRKKILDLDHQSYLVEMLCARKYAIGADGVCFIELSENADYYVRSFSNNGTEIPFNSNGIRACARVANEKDIAGNSHKVETISGLFKSDVSDKIVSVEVPTPKEIDIKHEMEIPHNFESKVVNVSYVDAGFNHIVFRVEKITTFDSRGIGSILSNHTKYQPNGIDVSFYDLIDNHNINISTYEIGVGGVVNSSGNGAVSAFLVAELKKEISSPLIVHTWGGLLKVSRKENTVVVEGEARIAYSGYITSDMLNFDIDKIRKKGFFI
jgi:diaminopimelate epimerase